MVRVDQIAAGSEPVQFVRPDQAAGAVILRHVHGEDSAAVEQLTALDAGRMVGGRAIWGQMRLQACTSMPNASAIVAT